MRANRILFAQLALLFVITAVTWFAVAYFLYWRIWWLDIPMHFFGGFWAGLVGVWLVARRGETFSPLGCALFALAVGTGWEIFEYSEHLVQPLFMSYGFDTLKDLIMDALGGFSSAIFAKHLMRLPK